MRVWLVVVAATGCQFSADPIGVDDMPPPAAYRISGHASTVGVIGSMPLSGVTVEALADPDGKTLIATGESASDGSYEIMVPTGTVAVLHARASSYFDTYLYPAATLSTDADGLDLVLMTSGTFDLLASLVQITQDVSMGWIGVRVVDAGNNPLSGASIQATGAICYNGPGGLPVPGGTQTQSDGTAYVFNSPVGAAEISVLHVGMPFAIRSIPVLGNTVTLAFIGPEMP